MFRSRPGNKDGDHAAECGLLGITLDPKFDSNGWIYMLYSVVPESRTRLSRFTFKDNKVDLSSEKMLLDYATDRDHRTCHEGGSLAFGPKGELPFPWATTPVLLKATATPPWTDAWTAANSIPSVPPETRTTSAAASCASSRSPMAATRSPRAIAYKPGTPKTRPEIFVKGTRNPFRISVDPLEWNLVLG